MVITITTTLQNLSHSSKIDSLILALTLVYSCIIYCATPIVQLQLGFN
jgi:hypothetical protein